MRWDDEDVVNIDDIKKKENNIINDKILIFNWSVNIIFMLISNA